MPSVAVCLFRPGRSLAMTACAMLLYATLAITPLPANALTFTLDVELDTGLTGDFATVDITENAGALDFTITLNTDLLGPDADLNELYFTIGGSTDLVLSDTNAPTNEYQLALDPAVRGGAGSFFDVAINFGNGAGPAGNGVLQVASFTLSDPGDVLTLAAIANGSFAQGGSIEVDLVAHVQGTSLIRGASSESIGGVVPEPAAGPLALMGLILLAAGSGGRPRHR